MRYPRAIDRQAVALLGLAAFACAHGNFLAVGTIPAGGGAPAQMLTTYNQPNPDSPGTYNDDPGNPMRPGWPYAGLYNINDDWVCGTDALSKPAKGTLDVNAGDTVSLKTSPWTQPMATDHFGPVMAHITDCGGSCDGFTGKGPDLKWTKIYEDVYSDNAWGGCKINKNNDTINVPIPTGIKPGNYILRTDIWVLQWAKSIGSGQDFGTCVQLKVNQGGSCTLPEDQQVVIPGDVYGSMTPPAVQGQVYTGGGGASYKSPGKAPWTPDASCRVASGAPGGAVGAGNATAANSGAGDAPGDQGADHAPSTGGTTVIHKEKSKPIVPIVLGAVGGFLLLLLVIFCCCYKRSKDSASEQKSDLLKGIIAKKLKDDRDSSYEQSIASGKGSIPPPYAEKEAAALAAGYPASSYAKSGASMAPNSAWPMAAAAPAYAQSHYAASNAAHGQAADPSVYNGSVASHGGWWNRLWGHGHAQDAQSAYAVSAAAHSYDGRGDGQSRAGFSRANTGFFGGRSPRADAYSQSEAGYGDATQASRYEASQAANSYSRGGSFAGTGRPAASEAGYSMANTARDPRGGSPTMQGSRNGGSSRGRDGSFAAGSAFTRSRSVDDFSRAAQSYRNASRDPGSRTAYPASRSDHTVFQSRFAASQAGGSFRNAYSASPTSYSGGPSSSYSGASARNVPSRSNTAPSSRFNGSAHSYHN